VIEESDEDADESPTTEVHQKSAPEKLVDKRSRFIRRQSVMQYMRDQASIDDDPMAALYLVSLFDLQKITHPKLL
jgi:hypothetical protein